MLVFSVIWEVACGGGKVCCGGGGGGRVGVAVGAAHPDKNTIVTIAAIKVCGNFGMFISYHTPFALIGITVQLVAQPPLCSTQIMGFCGLIIESSIGIRLQ